MTQPALCDLCGKPPAGCTCDLERAALEDWCWSDLEQERDERGDGIPADGVPDDGFGIYGADHGFRGR